MTKNLIIKNLYAILLILAQSLVLAGIVLLSVFPTSCKLTEVTGILSGDYATPVINQFIVKDELTVEVYFSEEVKIRDSSLSSCEKEDDKSVIIFTLPQAAVPGKEYVITGQVEDKNGNSLTFSIPFVGFNSNIPKLLITELQTESVSSRNALEKNNDYYKTEFIEILALSGGNLSGLEIVSAHDGEDKKYVFPNIDVEAGELFVVHLRKRGSGCVSEEGKDFSLARTSYTNDDVRDLWSESEVTALGNKTDVVLIRNSADGSVLDGIMFVDKEFTEWKESYLSYVQLLVKSGIYESGDMNCCAKAGEKTNSKTISRVDAEEFRRLVLEGVDVEYPVKNSCDFWNITTASCGILN